MTAVDVLLAALIKYLSPNYYSKLNSTFMGNLMAETDKTAVGYRKCIVAYLDILGFREKILEAESDASRIQPIYNALTSAQSLAELLAVRRTLQGEPRPSLEFNAVSDTIILSSFDVSSASFFYMLQDISLFQSLVLRKGTFLRGALAIGDCYHENNVLFGPVLIKAYDMEQSMAYWPRVVIAPDALQNYLVEDLDWKFMIMLRRDISGITYVDYLKYEYVSASKDMEEHGKSLYKTPKEVFEQHRNALLNAKNKKKTGEAFKTLVKYHALASYHNDVIEELVKLSWDKKKNNESLSDMKIDLGQEFKELYGGK